MVALVFVMGISLYAIIHIVLFLWRRDAIAQDAHIEVVMAHLESREAQKGEV
ncbi:hypothetical protein [Sphingomonas crocodyli]|uniref:hypothetical protein n=1 Tax=Sphingomonas crocodyli TaxID=1979270 RepID=UPI0013E29370|nr:hypothetical protein [Sphingomonas crocodyli]